MPTPDLSRAHVLLARGELAAAAAECRRILAADASATMALALLGHVLRRLGRDDEAAEALARALAAAPSLTTAWKDLAIVELRRGNPEPAAKAAAKAVERLPGDPWAAFTLGHALSLLHRFDQAERAFGTAAKLGGAPIASARAALIEDARARRDLDAAVFHARALVGASPDETRAWTRFAQTLIARDDAASAEAIDALHRALALSPGDTAALRVLADAIEQSRANATELLELRRRIVASEPESIAAMKALALAEIGAQQYDAGIATSLRVLQRDPSDLLARWVTFEIAPYPHFRSAEERAAFRARWIEELGELERLDFDAPTMRDRARETLGSVPNFQLMYFGEADVDLHRRHAALVRRMLAAALGARIEDRPVERIRRTRRRVGVLTSCVYFHAVTRAWAGALLELPRESVELCVFYAGTREDAMTARFRARADRFVMGVRRFDEWAAEIRASDLDVAIFLDIGIDALNQALASIRFAPVQAATWAHPSTTGIATIDYFLSADLAEPENGDEHYSERLVRLPGLGGSFEAPATAPSLRRHAAAAPRFVTLQSLIKLHPGHDAAFAEIAARCPSARFTVMTGASASLAASLAERLGHALRRHEVDPARFEVLPKLGLEGYAARLAEADIVLDTFDFSGCLTTLDALALDKPVLTLPGTLMRGRQSHAMLRRLGLAELAAESVDDYVERAANWGADADRRESMAGAIADRKRVLFGDTRVAPALGAFLAEVQPPEPR